MLACVTANLKSLFLIPSHAGQIPWMRSMSKCGITADGFAFFIPPPPFFNGARAEFDMSLDSCWYGSVLVLFQIRVKTDEKDRKGKSVLMECDCAMIDCLFDFALGCR